MATVRNQLVRNQLVRFHSWKQSHTLEVMEWMRRLCRTVVDKAVPPDLRYEAIVILDELKADFPAEARRLGID